MWNGVSLSELDKKDVEILKMLRVDSRTPMGTIGESLGISKATVSRRVAKMEEEGIIRSFSLEIDPPKIDLMKSLVFMQIVGNPVAIVIEQLKSNREIGHIYKTFGDHNIICEIYTRTVDELYEMIQTKLLKMPSIKNVEVDILVERVTMNVNADLAIYSDSFEQPKG
jgi:Lrp/AsnC family transcriptional regulator for asnA, asnC and gidA